MFPKSLPLVLIEYPCLIRFFADILLTPLEATRIRLVSDRNFATGLVTGFTRIAREGGIRELYAGFLPILCKSVLLLNSLVHGHNQLIITIRQIPYAIGQFTVNEWCHELAFRRMSEEQKQSLMASRLNKLTLDFGSGIIAGCAAAILSHVRPQVAIHGSSLYN